MAWALALQAFKLGGGLSLQVGTRTQGGTGSWHTGTAMPQPKVPDWSPASAWMGPGSCRAPT